MKSYKGKVAVVTGAAGGIGQALAVEFARQGANLAICDVIDMTETLDRLKAYAVDVYSASVDMASKPAINEFVDNVIDKYSHVDVLINNAGIALGDLTFDEVTEADFERITNINYWGVVHTTQKFYPYMIKRPEAAVANVSSSQGILAAPYLVAYCTTKFAVRGFTDSLRTEHKIRGVNNISFHTIHPGAVATNITINADYHNDNTESFHKGLQKGTQPSEAAAIILKGILKDKGRIFISDGRMQDWLARILPTVNHKLIAWFMRWQGMPIR